ncbi:MAG TPA: hypothetical protein VFW75_00865 [Acetobacteraceae bacterium]|nr:hypothetical protein [Acetobacteraceae bacterium]
MKTARSAWPERVRDGDKGTASYNYTPMLPLYSMIAATTLAETASVRLY